MRMAYPSLPRTIAGGLLVAAVAGALFSQDLGRYPLWDPDEARHAEVAREMAAAHGIRRLLLPTLDLAPYREKPAGYYWLVTLAYAGAGVGEAQARMVSVAAALLSVLALYVYALPRAGIAAAIGAALVAATSAGWFALARYANLDMLFTACVTVGVLAGLAWLERPAARSPMLAPFVAAGVGTLVKGPLAGVLIGAPLALAVLLARPRPPWRALGLPRGLAVALTIAALLFVPVGILDLCTLGARPARTSRRSGGDGHMEETGRGGRRLAPRRRMALGGRPGGRSGLGAPPRPRPPGGTSRPRAPGGGRARVGRGPGGRSPPRASRPRAGRAPRRVTHPLSALGSPDRARGRCALQRPGGGSPRRYPGPRARHRLRRARPLTCVLPRHASDRDGGSGAGAPTLRSRRPGLPRDGPEPLRRDRGPPRHRRVPLARHRAPPPLRQPPAPVGETPAARGKVSA
ncbi:MAG: hypothetical protein E6J81_14835 [Deltaproteobacteria bacterium]|nr:MAG: hypothetical protein E6J81_14835 [Deltaproteobacteria bacterium]